MCGGTLNAMSGNSLKNCGLLGLAAEASVISTRVDIQRDSKRLTQFRTSIFPVL